MRNLWLRFWYRITGKTALWENSTIRGLIENGCDVYEWAARRLLGKAIVTNEERNRAKQVVIELFFGRDPVASAREHGFTTNRVRALGVDLGKM